MSPLDNARRSIQDSLEGDPHAAARAQALALIAIAEQLEVAADAVMLLPTLATEFGCQVDRLVQALTEPQPVADHPAVRWDGPGCLMCEIPLPQHPAPDLLNVNPLLTTLRRLRSVQ